EGNPCRKALNRSYQKMTHDRCPNGVDETRKQVICFSIVQRHNGSKIYGSQIAITIEEEEQKQHNDNLRHRADRSSEYSTKSSCNKPSTFIECLTESDVVHRVMKHGRNTRRLIEELLNSSCRGSALHRAHQRKNAVPQTLSQEERRADDAQAYQRYAGG